MEQRYPMQIGVILIGDWKNTRKALIYLVLLLNTKQNLFEFQIHELPEIKVKLDNEAIDLLDTLIKTKDVCLPKDRMNHVLEEIANEIFLFHRKENNMFSDEQIPSKYIFVSPSKHIDEHFFQIDGTNGEGREEGNECRGAVILTGHHKRALSPPSVVEFTFKFLMRISLKWMYPEFVRSERHYGQKGCLFDYTNSPDLLRYMILHNYICKTCASHIGNTVKEEVLNALDSVHLYGCEIERHPAKISSRLGFNLSLVKGLYQTKYERFLEALGESFCQRLGSLFACALILSGAVLLQFDTGFVTED